MKPCETNIAQLTGKMISRPAYSHSVYEEAFYCFSFGVPRLSGHVDILPVILPVSALKEVGLEETLELKGQLRSYNQAEGGANHLHIRFFVQELQPAGSSCACAQRQNYVFLEGFLCKPPVYRTTPFGREIADMLLAVNRSFKKSDYIPVIAWGQNARFVRELKVGQKMRIEGRFQSREYEKCLANGEKIIRTAYEVSASSVCMVI